MDLKSTFQSLQTFLCMFGTSAQLLRKMRLVCAFKQMKSRPQMRHLVQICTCQMSNQVEGELFRQ